MEETIKVYTDTYKNIFYNEPFSPFCYEMEILKKNYIISYIPEKNIISIKTLTEKKEKKVFYVKYDMKEINNEWICSTFALDKHDIKFLYFQPDGYYLEVETDVYAENGFGKYKIWYNDEYQIKKITFLDIFLNLDRKIANSYVKNLIECDHNCYFLMRYGMKYLEEEDIEYYDKWLL